MTSNCERESARRRRVTIALATVAMALAASFGASAARAGAPGRPTAVITITDFSVSMPDTIQAGYDAFTVTNAGSMPHDASFIRLSPGATLSQVIDAAQNADTPEGFLAFQQLVSFNGGPAGIGPGTTVQIALNLPPGSYAVGDGQHLTDGVVKSFIVTAPPSDVAPPLADISVTQREFAFDVAATVKAGQATFQIHNAGQQTHEMQLIRLDAGHTLDDLKARLQDDQPPDWVHFMTSWDAAAPGVDGTLTLQLTPGTYAMLCFLPDAETGKPHAQLGMVNSFTAQ